MVGQYKVNHTSWGNPPLSRKRQGTLTGEQGRTLSKATIYLFLIFVAYTACPIIDVPGLDLSLSALILLFIAIEIFLGGSLDWLAGYSGWIMLAGLFWLGILMSLVGNILFGDQTNIDVDNWKYVIRFAYWMLAFLITIYVVSTTNLGPKIVQALIWAILLTSLFRWGEVIFFNKVGAWVGTITMTQNTYGILFSTYTPCILVPLVSSNRKKWLAALAALLVWGAVVINGSRGSWISVSLGICLFMGMYAVAHPARIYRLVPLLLLPLVLGGALLLAPQVYTEKVAERFDTFQQLDQDKSFQTRQLMIQKGWKMFLDSPVFGAGAGNFRKEMVRLELSQVMRHVSQARLNRKSAHNSYLALLGETGLVGCLPFAMLILTLVIKGYQAVLALARREEFWGLGIYVGFLMMSLHLWALSGLTGTGTWVMYGLVAGMIVSTSRDIGNNATLKPYFRR
ncbi:MAG: O-antigen ligase family protein [Desulfobacca sp.]|nr:O-antigen ligase family protein [Desulfobacca sp.]